ncbi:MAG: hypothetical protein ACRENF_02790 [Thermodesulfobacteriota bacterium]
MKIFEFVAFGPSGRKELGTVKAWRLAEAKKKIQEMGFYLASIKIKNDSAGSGVSPTGSGIKREDSRETSSHSKKPLAFFEGLKKFFFSRKKGRNS